MHACRGPKEIFGTMVLRTFTVCVSLDTLPSSICPAMPNLDALGQNIWALTGGPKNVCMGVDSPPPPEEKKNKIGGAGPPPLRMGPYLPTYNTLLPDDEIWLLSVNGWCVLANYGDPPKKCHPSLSPFQGHSRSLEPTRFHRLPITSISHP